MRRRRFIGLLGGAAARPLAVRAQQGERMRHIAVAAAWTPGDVQSAPSLAAFTRGLQELGWVNGRNIRIECLKTARAIGLAVPPQLIARADEVIE